MQTEDSLIPLYAALHEMYPGLKKYPQFMAIDEIDECSLGDTHRMKEGKITICQKIANVANVPHCAVAEVTATPYGPLLTNMEKFRQADLDVMVPTGHWQQELSAGNSYVGLQTYYSPEQDAANNIISSEDCPGYVIDDKVEPCITQINTFIQASVCNTTSNQTAHGSCICS